MTVRIECDVDGLTGNWIEISDRWTQREAVAMVEVVNDDFYALLRAKTVAVHIDAGEITITSPDQLDADHLLDADVAVLGWLGSVLPIAVARRRTLGNASARLSFSANGSKMPATIAAPTPT